ncbi:hypothetical protein NC652_007938 [Populus alba x Populus x berolinensis]|nr:hypothetical protein NC652_007938 [Populus alba x Populus x berolinensis]
MASAKTQFPTKSTPNQIQFLIQVIHHQSEWLVRFLLPHDAPLALRKPITNSPAMAEEASGVKQAHHQRASGVFIPVKQRKKKSTASKVRGRENQRADERENQNQAEQDTGKGILPSFKTPGTHVPHREFFLLVYE